MLSLFDRKIVAETRSKTGATNTNQFSDSELEKELERTKQVVSDEIHETLKNTGKLNFGEKATKNAIRYYMFLHTAGKVGGVDVPSSPSAIRLTDFEDTQMNFWRDRLIKSLREI